MARFPSGDQANPFKPLSSSVLNSLRSSPDVDASNQVSRSPKRFLLAPNAIEEPSGETDHASLSSPSLCGATPNLENSQIVVFEPEKRRSSPDNCALATNLELSGNQPMGGISHSTSLPLKPWGLGTTWISPVSTILTYIPLLSA